MSVLQMLGGFPWGRGWVILLLAGSFLAGEYRAASPPAVPARAPSGVIQPAPGFIVPVVPAGGLNVNQASAQDLVALPGVGPKIAQEIVDYRTVHGPYKRPEDLLPINGIGPKKVLMLTPLIRF